ncbi:MAG TPA: hypothetical protein VLT81_17525, partial [Chondromyces sp.]|nr:hypothetical protein [Chondromyces sp.]
MRNADVSTSFACIAVLCLIAAAGAAEEGPQITSTQRYVFAGQTVCVCGHFPTPASRGGLTIGGVPLGEPVSASSSRLEFQVPESVSPGPQRIAGPVSAGFAPGSGVEIEVLRLEGSIDQELLRSGQSTPMQIRIVGTDDRLELRLTNETPQIIAIEGGDDGVVLTSGGAENTVARTVRGLQPGDFDITYGVADDPCPCAPVAPVASSGGAETGPLVRWGYPLPEGVSIIAARGTGRTTGHIADITVGNSSQEPVLFPDRAAYIPSTGRFQSYVVPGGSGTTIPPGATRTVPVHGYCGDIHRPPVPAGEPMVGLEDWIVPTDPARTAPPPPMTAVTVEDAPPTRALVPGSDRALPGVIDPDTDPEAAAPYLWTAAGAIERAVAELQAEGVLRTPFSSDPDREREAVAQQTLWRFAGELTGEPYTREEFETRLVGQYEERTGVPIAEAPPADRERLEQGADDFWDAFELVGVEAKVLISEEDAPDTATEPEQAAEEVVEPPCDIAKTMEHSEPGSDFKMSENYKDEEKRANLREWFDDLPDPSSGDEGGTFEAGTHPASAWALAGRDFVGGYCNGVAKHVFQEAGGGTDWVWTTELLEVEARSEGSHTVTVTPPPGGACETLVVGAAGGLVKAWSNAIDPVADSRGIIEALRVVRDVAIIVASATAAPFTAGASIAVGVGVLAASKAFDAEFSSDANAAAAVEGRMRLQVKNRWIMLDANSRSSVSGSGEIESDETKVAKGQTSAQDPLTLTATTEGFSTLKTRAEDNGIAEGTIESQIGITIVGFCICDGDVQIEYLLDSGL